MSGAAASHINRASFGSDLATNRFNDLLDRYFPIYIIAIVALGLTFNRIGGRMSDWTVPILALQMFLMALSVKLGALYDAVRRPKYLLIWGALAWGVLPAVSFVLGKVFLGDQPEFAAGLVLTTSLPTAVTANVWTGISQGSLPLAITLVGAASVLSGIFTPLLLHSWVGVLVALDSRALFMGFLVSVMVPTLGGIFLNEWLGKRLDAIRPATRLISKLTIGLVMFVNASVLQPQLHGWGWNAAGIIVLVVLQAILAYWLALFTAARLGGISRADTIALTYTTGMRNNSAGIVIGMTFFGPAVAAPVILSILIQQPLASLVHRFVFARASQTRQLQAEGKAA